MLKIKPVARFLGQVILISGITFILSEITFRIYNKINPAFVFYDYSYNRWRGKPHAEDYEFKLNSQGFKDVEFNTQKDPQTYRILGIGDSFTFGVVPYPDNYLTVLEEQLNQAGKAVEIINMGIPGMGPRDYLSILSNEGLDLNPDRVIISFFIGNDFMDNDWTKDLRRKNYSYVIEFFRSLIKIQQNYEGHIFSPRERGNYQDDQPTLSEESFLEIEQERSMQYLTDQDSQEQFKELFEDAVNDIKKIKELCDYKNIALTVVIIPDEVQVNPELQAKIIERFELDNPSLMDFTLPNRLLQAELQEANIDSIDLLENFIVGSQQQRLYKPLDTHWNIAGNQLAADIIQQQLSPKIEQDFTSNSSD
jgi:lysophospholipase L1-like esterase